MMFDFPSWLRITHYVNFLLITLLARSGIQILADHPMLYWNEHCTPGSEWIRFSKKKRGTDRIWTSMDEAVDVSAWLALPGGYHSLGVARHWHFFTALLWVLNGVLYVLCLFSTGQWKRMIPTSLSAFSDAWHTALIYLSFHLPPASDFHPYDPLQRLTYAGIVFIIAPLTIMTGAAMSPAVAARFPDYLRLFGGRQKARSIHFLLLVIYLGFLVIHVTLVCLTGFAQNMNRMVFNSQGQTTLAIIIAISAVIFVILLNILVTIWSQKNPEKIQTLENKLVAPIIRKTLARFTSRQKYAETDITSYFWVNGLPPDAPEWEQHALNHFQEWKLQVHGLIQTPQSFSLEELQAMTAETQITQHVCIQGWTGVAEWTGVSLAEIIRLCKPIPTAKYLIFQSFQLDEGGIAYYNSLSLKEASQPQTILAYAMNGKPLKVENGAPLRLRIETMLGYRMTKWIKSIEFVESYKNIGLGKGGYREDWQFYSIAAEI